MCEMMVYTISLVMIIDLLLILVVVIHLYRIQQDTDLITIITILIMLKDEITVVTGLVIPTIIFGDEILE
jgi:hypothetical protein